MNAHVSYNYVSTHTDMDKKYEVPLLQYFVTVLHHILKIQLLVEWKVMMHHSLQNWDR